ncbi:hypothetical protein MES4922_300023 [Mesorhizobium ventifaucium]|uniref:Uncharacterized protein n=1 Tax=Mesorhizobium ventifaucium TaxID=666020 RepID=A0ABN8JXI2_9HYPH|nr:hypothetical protein MES4922_300023 [Mesorhizobium ventifaucium]
MSASALGSGPQNQPASERGARLFSARYALEIALKRVTISHSNRHWVRRVWIGRARPLPSTLCSPRELA